jgi:hypothetical protein
MQRDAGVPATLVSVIEASLILVAVGVQAIRSRRQVVGFDTHAQAVDA